MPKHYIAYDGRAMFDTDKASVLESLGPVFSKKDYNMWEDHDAVLVEYDLADGKELVNERVIGHWSEGFAVLKSRLGK